MNGQPDAKAIVKMPFWVCVGTAAFRHVKRCISCNKLKPKLPFG